MCVCLCPFRRNIHMQKGNLRSPAGHPLRGGPFRSLEDRCGRGRSGERHEAARCLDAAGRVTGVLMVMCLAEGDTLDSPIENGGFFERKLGRC